MSQLKALIIDDEYDICELISMSFIAINIDCTEAYSVSDAIVALQNEQFDICFTDLKLPDGDGFDVIKYIQANMPELPVAMMTAHGNVESAIEALKLGAFDFISKPFDIDILRKLALDAVKIKTLTPVRPIHGMYGESNEMENLRMQISKFARSQAPVYIHGESGTGKELASRAIHNESARCNGPFIAVNCGAIPEHLVESEFFGHKKGSFTGADRDKIGLFQAAHNGTLMLDEVADLPQSMQVKLLRAIQERAVRPVGGTEEISIDVRIISATHKNLEQLVIDQKFRQDLFYRLNVITLDLPPLRERLADLPILTNKLLEKINEANETQVRIAPEALKALRDYSFPGNIRELENILERASALCDDELIEEENLQLAGSKMNDLLEARIEMPTSGSSFLSHSAPPCDNVSVITEDYTIVLPAEIHHMEHFLEAVERQILERSLKENVNKTEAAKSLGLSFRTFRYRLKKLDIED